MRHSMKMTGRMPGLRGAYLVLAMVAVASPTSATPAAVADEIGRLEKDINAAYAANDLPTYFAFYADDLRALFPEGPTTLPAYKSSWTDFIKSGGAIVSFTYSDMVIEVGPSEDTAVASYLASARTKTPGKGISDEAYSETDVWFKRGDAWKIVEIHYSPNPPAGK